MGEQKAPPGLATQIAPGDLSPQGVKNVVTRVVGHGRRQAFAGGQIDVSADKVDQRKRAKPVARCQHRGVNIGCAAPLLQEGQRLAIKRPGTAVDDESRPVGAGDDRLACGLGQVPGLVQRAGGRSGMRHQFDQLHHGGRVKEMQPQQTLGVRKRPGHGSNRQG